MKNLPDMVYTTETKIKAGYRIIGLVTGELIALAMRIALAGELKCIKTLVNPLNCSPDDMELLTLLDDPDVKLACSLIDELLFEILPHYALMHLLDQEEVCGNKPVEKLANSFFWRFMFLRTRHRRRDCRINFYKALQAAQRLLYEWCKLMINDENNSQRIGYRCNYSAGRLKALLAGQSEFHVEVAAELIQKLKDYQTRTCYFKNIQKK